MQGDPPRPAAQQRHGARGMAAADRRLADLASQHPAADGRPVARRLPGAAGNRAIRTPNLDQLAAGGVRFTNAYSATPPARRRARRC
jgi:hypothetical protein